jgi:hypothetical protein
VGDLGDREDVDEVEEELDRRRLLALAVAPAQVRDATPCRWRGGFDLGGDAPILRAELDDFCRL